jgi:hypothetical protein
MIISIERSSCGCGGRPRDLRGFRRLEGFSQASLFMVMAYAEDVL